MFCKLFTDDTNANKPTYITCISLKYIRHVLQGSYGSHKYIRDVLQRHYGSHKHIRAVLQGPYGSHRHFRAVLKCPNGGHKYIRVALQGPKGSHKNIRTAVSSAEAPTGWGRWIGEKKRRCVWDDGRTEQDSRALSFTLSPASNCLHGQTRKRPLQRRVRTVLQGPHGRHKYIRTVL